MNPTTPMIPNPDMAQGSDPLAALRDIHLPEAVSFWPLAPGWWAAIAFVVAVCAVAELLRRRRLASLRTAALRELDEIETDWRASHDVGHLALVLSGLLRRVAMLRYPRSQVASLVGSEWSDFLEREGAKSPGLVPAAETMGAVLYGPPGMNVDEQDGASWIEAVRSWIRRKA